MKNLLGFQYADKEGYSIQGDEDDPTGLRSFEVIHPDVIANYLRVHPWKNLIAIYEGDIEEPTIMRF